MTYSAYPDHLASSEANWSGSTLFAKEGISGFNRTGVMVYVYSGGTDWLVQSQSYQGLQCSSVVILHTIETAVRMWRPWSDYIQMHRSGPFPVSIFVKFPLSGIALVINYSNGITKKRSFCGQRWARFFYRFVEHWRMYKWILKDLIRWFVKEEYLVRILLRSTSNEYPQHTFLWRFFFFFLFLNKNICCNLFYRVIRKIIPELS